MIAPALRPFLALCLALLLAPVLHAQDDWLDDVSRHLVIGTPDGKASARISGLLDLEAYSFRQPAPGLIYAPGHSLFTPRLSLFLDAQLGSQLYFFAQTRFDRSFDPSHKDIQVRLDEYALRWNVLDHARLNIQIGKFATVAGNWNARHLSWDNPFISAPLPYENLTSIWDNAAVDVSGTLVDWNTSEHIIRVPIIWGPSYASGASVSGRLGDFEYAAEIKNASLSSRPEAWTLTNVGFQHPTYSGRLNWRPDMAWNLGFSASTGSYLLPEAKSTLLPGKGLDDYRQILLGQDVSFEWHHWQVWAEVFETRFEIPGVGNADTLAYYIESKYKFSPEFFGALRWNQQVFNKFQSYTGENVPWTDDTWRIDAALTWRFSPHIQAKAQYSYLHMDGPSNATQDIFAGQITVKF